MTGLSTEQTAWLLEGLSLSPGEHRPIGTGYCFVAGRWRVGGAANLRLACVLAPSPKSPYAPSNDHGSRPGSTAPLVETGAQPARTAHGDRLRAADGGVGHRLGERGRGRRKRRPHPLDRCHRLQHRVGSRRRGDVPPHRDVRAIPSAFPAGRAPRRRSATGAGDDCRRSSAAPRGVVPRARAGTRPDRAPGRKELPDAGLTGRDFLGALGVFLLVFLSTFPVVVPFLLPLEPRLALRVSNGVAMVMLFLVGLRVGKYMAHRPLLVACGSVAVGAALVAITIALGG